MTLRVNEKWITEADAQYPGVREQIARYDAAETPGCPRCGSSDTAAVHVGVIGRTILLAGATSKFHLVPNGPVPGKNWCNACGNFFEGG